MQHFFFFLVKILVTHGTAMGQSKPTAKLWVIPRNFLFFIFEKRGHFGHLVKNSEIKRGWDTDIANF
jgi:hypothetical protein